MKLIDKSALVAKIKSIEYETNYEPFTDEILGKRIVCKDIKDFLGTLEVKEVDLDLEITLWANAIPEIRLDDVERIAKYFFELGLNTERG